MLLKDFLPLTIRMIKKYGVYMNSSEDVELIFRRIEEKFGSSDEHAKRMLGILITVTLAYRDLLVKTRQPPLTVGETQRALDSFMFVLKTQKFPEIEESRVKELVTRWLERLKKEKLH